MKGCHAYYDVHAMVFLAYFTREVWLQSSRVCFQSYIPACPGLAECWFRASAHFLTRRLPRRTLLCSTRLHNWFIEGAQFDCMGSEALVELCELTHPNRGRLTLGYVELAPRENLHRPMQHLGHARVHRLNLNGSRC